MGSLPIDSHAQRVLNETHLINPFRKTTQALAPATHRPSPGAYNVYPGYPIGRGEIGLGFDALARRLAAHQQIIIDGMGGVLWDDFRKRLERALASCGAKFEWLDVQRALKPTAELNQLLG